MSHQTLLSIAKGPPQQQSDNDTTPSQQQQQHQQQNTDNKQVQTESVVSSLVINFFYLTFNIEKLFHLTFTRAPIET